MTRPSDFLHVEASGGPPGADEHTFLLVHGYGATGYTWRHWTPALRRRGRILCVDLKGFGRAAKPDDGRYRPGDHVETLLDLLDERGADAVTLIGHSYGGGLALLAALELTRRDDARLRSLVIVAGAAYEQRLPPFVTAARYPRLARAAVRVLGAERVIRAALRMIVADPRAIDDDQVAAYAYGLRTRAGVRAALDTARHIVPDDLPELARSYPNVKVPTLLLWGRDDRVVPPWVGQRLAEELPRARLELLDECGHVPQEERPEDSLGIVTGFLDET